MLGTDLVDLGVDTISLIVSALLKINLVGRAQSRQSHHDPTNFLRWITDWPIEHVVNQTVGFFNRAFTRLNQLKGFFVFARSANVRELWRIAQKHVTRNNHGPDTACVAYAFNSSGFDLKGLFRHKVVQV